MLTQEKQGFHQQHLRTCANGIFFLYTDLSSACAQQHVFSPLGIADTKNEAY